MYSINIRAKILDWFPVSRWSSFDLGNIAFGAAAVEYDPAQLRGLPDVRAVLAQAKTLPEKLAMLYALVATYERAIDSLLKVYVDVWQLAESGKPLDTDQSARALKPKLQSLDKQYGPFDEALYEFQMNKNDKSRTVSAFVRYHYAGVCPLRKIGGSLKNTVTLAPHLDHRAFLRKYASPYTANKKHAAASLEYLARVWGFSLAHIDPSVRKDAGDALMQLWALKFKSR